MDNKEMFRQLPLIFSSGDVGRVDELFSPKYIDQQRPEWIQQRGAEEFKAIVKRARNSMPGLQVEIEGPVIADGEMVAGRLHWLSPGIERKTIEMLRVEAGRFVEHWGAEVWSKRENSSHQQ